MDRTLKGCKASPGKLIYKQPLSPQAQHCKGWGYLGTAGEQKIPGLILYHNAENTGELSFFSPDIPPAHNTPWFVFLALRLPWAHRLSALARLSFVPFLERVARLGQGLGGLDPHPREGWMWHSVLGQDKHTYLFDSTRYCEFAGLKVLVFFRETLTQMFGRVDFAQTKYGK